MTTAGRSIISDFYRINTKFIERLPNSHEVNGALLDTLLFF